MATGIVSLEFALRYYEKNARSKVLDYKNTGAKQINPGGRMKKNFRELLIGCSGEDVLWVTNNDGFRNERDFDKKPADGVVRVLSIGDSFAAGYRVGQTETYSYLLEKMLQKKYGKAEVLISQIESPVFGLKYFKSSGVEFNPHVVLLGITLGNDIAQTFVALDSKYRGFRNQGLEYFGFPDQCLQDRSYFNEAKRGIGYVWRHSKIVRRIFNPRREIISWHGNVRDPRLFDPVNGIGFYIDPSPDLVDQGYKRFFSILTQFQKICDERKIIFIAMIFPQRFQIQPIDWDVTVKQYGLRKECFNLDLPNNRIGDYCEKQNIILIDPTRQMANHYKNTNEELYCPLGDMHWNVNGHQAFFNGAQPGFEKVFKKLF